MIKPELWLFKHVTRRCYMHSHEVHLSASVHAVSSAITRAHCDDVASVAQCCSNALLLCFIDLAKGKADDRAGTRAVALGHVMVSLCLGLCIIGALSSTLVSGLSLSKGTFHPELTATESLIKERTLCLSDVNWISLSLTACMTSVTKKSCVWIIHFHWCQLWQNCF